MINLSERLCTVAALVRPQSRLADIGCDHGFVPVYLAEQGIIVGAVASDINEGPLASCRALVKAHGLEQQIKCVLSDGLEQIAADEVDDILIAGMGGEMIADILSRCAYVRQKHLILNPMTHPEIARRWLYDNGFSIDRDIIVREGRHYYSVFDATYTAATDAKTRADDYLGNITDFTHKGYFEHLLSYLKNKQKGGSDYSDVITAIEEKL